MIDARHAGLAISRSQELALQLGVETKPRDNSCFLRRVRRRNACIDPAPIVESEDEQIDNNAPDPALSITSANRDLLKDSRLLD